MTEACLPLTGYMLCYICSCVVHHLLTHNKVEVWIPRGSRALLCGVGRPPEYTLYSRTREIRQVRDSWVCPLRNSAWLPSWAVFGLTGKIGLIHLFSAADERLYWGYRVEVFREFAVFPAFSRGAIILNAICLSQSFHSLLPVSFHSTSRSR